MTESRAIGIIGLGALGEPLARNALAAGHEVLVFDVRPEAMEKLKLQGARSARSPADLGAQAGTVLIAVASGSQLEAVVLGNEEGSGLLSTAKAGTILVVHSTVGSEICRLVAERAAEHGVEVVDAPVTGSESAPVSARCQDMTYIVGARQESLDRVRGILELSGTALFHVGGVGDAQDVKLAVNALALVQMQATHETMHLLTTRGLTEENATEILSASSAANWAVDHWPTIAQAADAPGDPAAIPRKDLALAIRAAETNGIRLDLAERARDLITEPGHGFLAPTPEKRE